MGEEWSICLTPVPLSWWAACLRGSKPLEHWSGALLSRGRKIFQFWFSFKGPLRHLHWPFIYRVARPIHNSSILTFVWGILVFLPQIHKLKNFANLVTRGWMQQRQRRKLTECIYFLPVKWIRDQRLVLGNITLRKLSKLKPSNKIIFLRFWKEIYFKEWIAWYRIIW